MVFYSASGGIRTGRRMPVLTAYFLLGKGEMGLFVFLILKLIPLFRALPELKDQVVSLKDDNNKFEVTFDTHGYKPDELTVNVANGTITVEGKHEEKNETDGKNKSYASRHFLR